MSAVAIVLLAGLGACSGRPDRPPPPAPAADPSVAWGHRLPAVVSPDGEVDYSALRADPRALRDYVGWAAKHGPESDKWGSTDDNRRLAYEINALNANTLLAVVDGGAPAPMNGSPVAALRFTLDGEVVRYDRHVAHTILAIIEEPLAVAALGCAAWSCPPMPARLFQKSGVDEALAAQMGRWIGSGRLIWPDDHGGLVVSPALRPWLPAFARYAGADTPCEIVAPYVPEARRAALGPLLLAGECRYSWGAWEGRLDGG